MSADIEYRNDQPFFTLSVSYGRHVGGEDLIDADYLFGRYDRRREQGRSEDLRCDHEVARRSPISSQIERSP